MTGRRAPERLRDGLPGDGAAFVSDRVRRHAPFVVGGARRVAAVAAVEVLAGARRSGESAAGDEHAGEHDRRRYVNPIHRKRTIRLRMGDPSARARGGESARVGDDPLVAIYALAIADPV